MGVIAHPFSPPADSFDRLAASAFVLRKKKQFTPCAVYCQHRFENNFLAPVIISKIPVFAGFFDVFWVSDFLTADAGQCTCVCVSVFLIRNPSVTPECVKPTQPHHWPRQQPGLAGCAAASHAAAHRTPGGETPCGAVGS